MLFLSSAFCLTLAAGASLAQPTSLAPSVSLAPPSPPYRPPFRASLSPHATPFYMPSAKDATATQSTPESDSNEGTSIDTKKKGKGKATVKEETDPTLRPWRRSPPSSQSETVDEDGFRLAPLSRRTRMQMREEEKKRELDDKIRGKGKMWKGWKIKGNVAQGQTQGQPLKEKEVKKEKEKPVKKGKVYVPPPKASTKKAAPLTLAPVDTALSVPDTLVEAEIEIETTPVNLQSHSQPQEQEQKWRGWHRQGEVEEQIGKEEDESEGDDDSYSDSDRDSYRQRQWEEWDWRPRDGGRDSTQGVAEAVEAVWPHWWSCFPAELTLTCTADTEVDADGAGAEGEGKALSLDAYGGATEEQDEEEDGEEKEEWEGEEGGEEEIHRRLIERFLPKGLLTPL